MLAQGRAIYARWMEVLEAARSVEVMVIGAGQAGLSVSHELTGAGVPHVVLERNRVAQSWRDRWDSFTLVTPNWSILLPGQSFTGDDPEGFLPRDHFVEYLERYSTSFAAPVFEGVSVTGLGAGSGSALRLETSAGELTARAVVVCSGAYSRPHRPPIAAAFPAAVRVMDAADYRSPDDVDGGRVVVVGSGQTGCQLAEELHLAGREVILACGRAPWMTRRLDGLDTFTWLDHTAFFDTPLAALPSPAARLLANPQATGRDGGHDLHYRTLQALGVRLTGRLASVDSRRITFADDLAASVAFGDARYNDMRTLLSTQLPAKGIAVPDMPDPTPFHARPVESLATSDVSTVIFTSGYRPDYADWIRFPVFDDLGFPITTDGATTVPGLFFCGVHFLRNRKSAILMGIGTDATIVAGTVARTVNGRPTVQPAQQ